MKQCNKSRDYTLIDTAIKEKVAPYLYNGGEGKYVPTSEIVHVRQCIRSGQPVRPPTSRNRSGEYCSCRKCGQLRENACVARLVSLHVHICMGFLVGISFTIRCSTLKPYDCFWYDLAVPPTNPGSRTSVKVGPVDPEAAETQFNGVNNGSTSQEAQNGKRDMR